MISLRYAQSLQQRSLQQRSLQQRSLQQQSLQQRSLQQCPGLAIHIGYCKYIFTILYGLYRTYIHTYTHAYMHNLSETHTCSFSLTHVHSLTCSLTNVSSLSKCCPYTLLQLSPTHDTHTHTHIGLTKIDSLPLRAQCV
jgi:hypothetical protein